MASKLVLGLQEDIDTFISSFVSQDTHDYDSFAKIWKNMKFDCIFSGRRSVLEMETLTNEIFYQLVNRINPFFASAERICSVFLLHSLYYLQPLKNRVKIRIEMEQWQDLNFFMKTVRTENVEVAFCFNKLLTSFAFDFVESIYPYNIDMTNDRKPKELANLEFWKFDDKPKEIILDSVSKLLDVENEWSDLQDSYNRLKCELKEMSRAEQGRLPNVNLEERDFKIKLTSLDDIDGYSNPIKRLQIGNCNDVKKKKRISNFWTIERRKISNETGYDLFDNETSQTSSEESSEEFQNLNLEIIQVDADFSNTF